jgi:hypothetical protein
MESSSFDFARLPLSIGECVGNDFIKIICLSMLGVRKIPNLEATPTIQAADTNPPDCAP